MTDAIFKSESQGQNKFERFIDWRVDPIRNRPFQMGIVGVQNQTSYASPATSVSDSFIQFANISGVGENRVYSDKFYIEYDLTYKLVVQIPKSGEYQRITEEQYNNYDWSQIMPFPFPLSQMCDNMTLSINGYRFTQFPRVEMEVLLDYLSQEDLTRKLYTACPQKKLVYGQFFGVESPQFDNTGSFSEQCADNIQFGQNGSTLIDTTLERNLPQGSTVYLQTFTQRHHIREPVFCSPLNRDFSDEFGQPLWNITALELSLSLGEKTRIIQLPKAYDTAANLQLNFSDFGVQISNPILRQQVQNTSLSLPRALVLPVRTMDYVRTPHAETTTELTMKPQTLNTIPHCVYIAAVLREGSFNAQFSPQVSIAHITGLSITLGNQTSLLSTKTVTDLQQTSLRNGMKDVQSKQFDDTARPFPVIDVPETGTVELVEAVWAPFRQNVIKLVFGSDLTLPGMELIPGSAAPEKLLFEVKATVSYRPKVTERQPLDLLVVFEKHGEATILPTSGVLDMQPVKMTQDQAQQLVNQEESGGGKIWDAIKLGAKNLHQQAKEKKWISRALKAMGEKQPMLEKWGQAAEKMGYGGSEMGHLQDPPCHRGKKRGAGTIAGGTVAGGTMAGGTMAGGIDNVDKKEVSSKKEKEKGGKKPHLTKKPPSKALALALGLEK